MAEPKTAPTKTTLTAYLATIADPDRRRDARALADLMSRASDAGPVIWGTSIVGFGRLELPGARGKTTPWPILAFATRAQAFVLYLRLGGGAHQDLLRQLGKFTVKGGCLHIRQLSDVDIPTLSRLLAQSVRRLKGAG